MNTTNNTRVQEWYMNGLISHSNERVTENLKVWLRKTIIKIIIDNYCLYQQAGAFSFSVTQYHNNFNVKCGEILF